jgi:hypothetical protein
MMWHHWFQMVKYIEYELSREAPVIPQLLFACCPWGTADHKHSVCLCLTHSLVLELLEILRMQLVHACARSCTECTRMIHWLSAWRCTKQLTGTTKYYDSGTVIACCALEECALECLCTCCNELLLFVHSSGGIYEEIPLWNGEWCHQIQTQQWVSQAAHTCTCLQHWFLTSSPGVPSLFWCFNIPVTPHSYWFYFLVWRVYKPGNS